MVNNKDVKNIKMHEYVREFCEQHSVEFKSITERRRDRGWVIRLRQRLFYELHIRGHSLPEIGEFLNRDHTTVLWGKRRHLKRIEEINAQEKRKDRNELRSARTRNS